MFVCGLLIWWSARGWTTVAEGHNARHTRAQLERLVGSLDEVIDGLGDWHDATEHLEWVRKRVCEVLAECDAPVLEYIEEVEELPDGAVIRDVNGLVAEYQHAFGPTWWATIAGSGYRTDFGFASHDLALPVTVLYNPDADRD